MLGPYPRSGLEGGGERSGQLRYKLEPSMSDRLSVFVTLLVAHFNGQAYSFALEQVSVAATANDQHMAHIWAEIADGIACLELEKGQLG
jgi:hypothetical protein